MNEISVQNSTLKNCGVGWRHEKCSMVSINAERCEACKKYSKSLSAKMSRLKKKKNFKRFAPLANPHDQLQLKALQKKLKNQKNKAKRFKLKLDQLTSSLGDDQNKVANLTDADLKYVDANEKIVIREIIAAAKVKDPRGRRYTDEFLMICMLMSIRSQSYYEFLRRNKIIPLPSTKTIRNYMSLINTKCGFDDEFFKLLKKSFSSKNEQKRHGVLLLDEINLRKSVAVSTKTLTYTGLTDFGDGEKQSSNIEDLATHGLVLQFQSITEKYTQPIAVFASKNAVSGDDLAKFVLRAICLLENAGAFIHGVVGDEMTTTRCGECWASIVVLNVYKIGFNILWIVIVKYICFLIRHI